MKITPSSVTVGGQPLRTIVELTIDGPDTEVSCSELTPDHYRAIALKMATRHIQSEPDSEAFGVIVRNEEKK